MHFVLLGFLPLGRMRRAATRATPPVAGSCSSRGRTSYEAMGGHRRSGRPCTMASSCPAPTARRGSQTDLFDATDVAVCRMYRSRRRGLARPGQERHRGPGLPGADRARPRSSCPAVRCLPVVLLALRPVAVPARPGAARSRRGPLRLPTCARLGVMRFRQPVAGAVLHPLGVLVLLAIQWTALARELLGRPATWKGRPYPARTGLP